MFDYVCPLIAKCLLYNTSVMKIKWRKNIKLKIFLLFLEILFAPQPLRVYVSLSKKNIFFLFFVYLKLLCILYIYLKVYFMLEKSIKWHLLLKLFVNALENVGQRGKFKYIKCYVGCKFRWQPSINLIFRSTKKITIPLQNLGWDF